MMPNWAAASEVWMQRMLELLADDLGAVVAWGTDGNSSWRNSVRSVALRQPPRSIRYATSIANRLGLTLMRQSLQPGAVLQAELKRSGITHILCNYGELAVAFMDTWDVVDLPLFVHFHGYDATFDICVDSCPGKEYFPDTYLPAIRLLSKRAVFIANSVYTKSLLESAGVAPNRIEVKYFGVPVPPHKKQHTDDSWVTVLHLGRLVDFKSPDRTIEAFEIACSRGLNGQLIIAGDGPMRVTCELLRLRSPYRDSIRILGEVSTAQAERLLQEADIFTQHNIKGEISRQSECFGVSVVEAMAMGLPVVGTRSGGVLETVVDGETGILVEPGDVHAQAEAILMLACDPNQRNAFGMAGRQRIQMHFSIDAEKRRLRSLIGL